MISSDIKLKDFYKHYSNNVESGITYKQYALFIDNFFKELKAEILKGFDFFMPENLGVLGVRLCKSNIQVNEKDGTLRGLNIDWGGTIKYYRKNIPELNSASDREIRKFIKNQKSEDKVILKHFNEHSKGFYGQLVYFKNLPGAISKYPGKQKRQFKPARSFKKEITKLISQGVEELPWLTI